MCGSLLLCVCQACLVWHNKSKRVKDMHLSGGQAERGGGGGGTYSYRVRVTYFNTYLNFAPRSKPTPMRTSFDGLAL